MLIWPNNGCRFFARRVQKATVLFAVVWLNSTAHGDLLGFESDRRREAEVFAAEIGGQLRPPQPLTQQIFNDLAAIRREFPLMNGISYRPRAVPQVLIVRFATTTRAGIEAGLASLAPLNESLGVVEAKPVIFMTLTSFNFGLLRFGPIYNMDLLADLYEQQPQVIGAETDHFIGGGNTIRLDGSVYTFTLGWGDCPSGCIHRRSWEFQVDRGQVTPLFDGPIDWPDEVPRPNIPIPEPAAFTIWAVAWIPLMSRYRPQPAQ